MGGGSSRIYAQMPKTLYKPPVSGYAQTQPSIVVQCGATGFRQSISFDPSSGAFVLTGGATEAGDVASISYTYGQDYVQITYNNDAVLLKTCEGTHYLTSITGSCPTAEKDNWPITGGFSSSSCEQCEGLAEAFYY